MQLRKLFPGALLAALLWAAPAAAQTTIVGGSVSVKGTVSTSAPTYQPGTDQELSLDPSGNLRVTCSNCSGAGGGTSNGAVTTSAPSYTTGTNQALSLTITGNLRTQDGADGPVSPGTAAALSHLAGGIFNSSAPTFTNGQQGALQLDASGNLNVNVKVGGGTGGTSSNFAATFPSVGTAIGMSQGGNMVAVTGTSGNLNVNCATGCTAASDTSNGPVTPGAAATTSKLGGLQFNTSAPTLTNAQQAALQGDSHANLLVNVNTPLPTGSNPIGQVGGNTASVIVTPTVTAAAYSAGQCVGGLMTFTNAARSGGPGSGLVQSIDVTDVSGQDSAVDIVLFSSNPTNSTFTDHATCAIANADLQKVIGTVHVTDCNLLGASAPGTCQAQQQAMPFALGAGNTTMYAVSIARGTPTYTATSNLAVRLETLED